MHVLSDISELDLIHDTLILFLLAREQRAVTSGRTLKRNWTDFKLINDF